MRPVRSHLAPAFLCALALGSCGGGERQDQDEPEGDFKLEVVEARFPGEQALAQRSDLRITVRSAEARRTVPNVAVTVKGFDARLGHPDAADPARPVFVINGRPQRIATYPDSKDAAPSGETAYNDTWALGPLEPGRQKTFEWTVTAVRAGPYRLSYKVSAGLDGRAKAVGARGRPPQGVFAGTVSEAPADARVGEDGRTVVE